MFRKISGYVGFVLVLLGVCGMDSPYVITPITMIVLGAVLLYISSHQSEKWTEK